LASWVGHRRGICCSRSGARGLVFRAARSSEIALFRERLEATIGEGQRSVEARWRRLFRNATRWTDCRAAKTQRLLHPRYPDFECNETGEKLWLRPYPLPHWVHKALQCANDAGQPLGSPPKVFMRRRAQRPPNHLKTDRGTTRQNSRTSSEVERRWRRLFDSPAEWIDNRAAKHSGRVGNMYPDFQSAATGEQLFLRDFGLPPFVLERLEAIGRGVAPPPWLGCQRRSATMEN